MQDATGSLLSQEQKLSLYSAYTFTQSATVYLKACLPIVREEDGRHLQTLIELGELASRRLQKYFPEIRSLVDGGVW